MSICAKCTSGGHQVIAATGLTIRERGDASRLLPHLTGSTDTTSIDFEALREWSKAYADCGLRALSNAAPCLVGDYYIDARRLAPVLANFKGPAVLVASKHPSAPFDPMMLIGEDWRFLLMGLNQSGGARRFAPRFPMDGGR